MRKLSFVIPVYNEEKTLKKLVSKVLAVKLPGRLSKELIIVNDCSKDRSLEITQDLAKTHPSIRVLTNEQNLGKSRTVKKGLLNSTGSLVIIQDADLEYDPNEIMSMVKLLQRNNFDVVYGNRFGVKNRIVYIQNYVGNKFLSFISNLFTYPRIRVWIPDMEVCYKLMKGPIARKVARKLTAKSSFGLEPEITARLSRLIVKGRHLRFSIVPISYDSRTTKEGKHMKALKDGIKALWEIVYYNVVAR